VRRRLTGHQYDGRAGADRADRDHRRGVPSLHRRHHIRHDDHRLVVDRRIFLRRIILGGRLERRFVERIVVVR
jgi:hypothetical protein